MRWLRRGSRPLAGWQPPERIPDGDTVLQPGQRRGADLLRQAGGGLRRRQEAPPDGVRYRGQ